MKVLVTGASGFVGSAVVRALLGQGSSVKALVRSTSLLDNLCDLDVERVTGDLRDAQSLERALQGCELAFHVAADYRLWVPDPEVMYDINVRGSERLLRAAASAGVERVVYTSSVATLGFSPAGPADEDTPVDEKHIIGHYKQTKFLAEQTVRRTADELGLPLIIVNPSSPFGPGDIKPTPTGQIVLDTLCGRMPAFVDTGLNVCHVDDIAQGHLLALEHGRVGERYILGGENLTLEAILGLIADAAGLRRPSIRIPNGVAMIAAVAAETWSRVAGGEPRITRDAVRMARRKMYFSSRKAREELGFAPRPAKVAIEDAVHWFSKQRASTELSA
ncbi:MAG: NAD-dependent epimerase/dehydratase family protein [Gammaproteobacteria bacterium]|nr:MAG: NAD-dependent epimerase/dehydratase family protein [Gammaproteobacteria bacterium]